jgi:hypothetical protein
VAGRNLLQGFTYLEGSNDFSKPGRKPLHDCGPCGALPAPIALTRIVSCVYSSSLPGSLYLEELLATPGLGVRTRE